MKSDTGLNARFSPVFDVIRDPLPVEPIVSDIVQVFDLVGLNINGYVGGKEYYGNVYFKNGVKLAGSSSKSGTNIRVFETREASISRVNVPVSRVTRVDETIDVQTVTTQTITAEPETTTPRTGPAPTSTPDSTSTTTPTSTPTSSPTPDPTPYTPPSTDSGGSSGGGGGYGYYCLLYTSPSPRDRG